MKNAKLFVSILTLLVCLPISYYIQCKTLQMIGASELMWFLFWVNVPCMIVLSILAKIFDND